MACIVKNCGNAIKYNPHGVSFHRFPARCVLVRKWVVLLDLRRGYVKRRKDRICSLHFSPEDFEMQTFGDKLRKYLKPGALPFDHRVDKTFEDEQILATPTDQSSLRQLTPAPSDCQSTESSKSLSESVDEPAPAISIHSVKQEAKAVCLVCEGLEDLLDITTEEFSHLHFKLHVVAEIQNEFTHWFKFICTSCSLALENAFDFKARCEETHRKLIANLHYETVTENITNFNSQPLPNANGDDDIVEEKPKIHFEIIEVVEKENDEFTNRQRAEDVLGDQKPISSVEMPKSENSTNTNSPQFKRPKKVQSEEIEIQATSSLVKFHCSMCTKSFYTKILLQTHIQDKHFKDLKKRRKPSFPCGTCKRTFCSKRYLTLHTDKYHNDPNAESGLRFKCNDCGRRFANSMGYKVHMKTHFKERTLSCYLCSETFEKVSELDEHVDMHFNTGYNCEMCGSTFKKASSFRFHMKFHTEKFPFQCPTCLMKFKERDMLLQHTGKCPVVLGLPAPGPSGYSGTAFGS